MEITKIIEEISSKTLVAILIEEEAENMKTIDIIIMIKRIRSKRPLDQELTVITSQL